MRPSAGTSILLGLLLFSGCDGHREEPVRTTAPGAIRLALPGEFGAPERPAVEFDHRVHVKALDQEGCGACHYVDARKRLLPRLHFEERPSDSGEWMEAHHRVCVDCHQKRLGEKQATGPTDCGRCHRDRPPAVTARRLLRFDYSLHHRHVRAQGGECSACHHVYDREQNKLVYRKGTEDACNTCHGKQGGIEKPSARDAAHIACINCHIERQGRVGRTGPWLCSGCHGAEELAEIQRIEGAPPPERGQPPGMWIAAEGATTNVVPFNHELHQGQTGSCSACHHESIGACAGCHTLLPGQKGGGVNLWQAYHMPGSELSCVGCHQEHAGRGQCAGCHRTPARVPGQAACAVCHRGPLPQRVATTQAPAVSFPPVRLGGLPEVSEDFPDEVEIGVLAQKYRPSAFPHERIVAALDKSVRESRLARRFHEKPETLCAGCHHHSPPDERPPACRSCHGDSARPGRDLPDLTAAYHRQCIGCHQAIGHRARGCSDCHQEVHE